MPWQHYVLIAELIASSIIATRFLQVSRANEYTLSARMGYGWAAVEAVMVALLIWGATHFAWQYFIVGLWFVSDFFVNIVHVGRTVDLSKRRPRGGSYVIYTSLLICTMFTLLYTAA